jgi:hypothetical protein
LKHQRKWKKKDTKSSWKNCRQVLPSQGTISVQMSGNAILIIAIVSWKLLFSSESKDDFTSQISQISSLSNIQELTMKQE